MALPQRFIDGNQPESHGIGVNLVPADPPTYQIELQRAPDNGAGAPGAFATILTLPPISASATYVDLLPADNAFRHYRARHVGPGYDPSTNWSAVGRGKPVRLEGPAAAGGLISLYPIVRSKPMSDGSFALKATDALGEAAHSAVKESGGKAINKLLAKPNAADPDHLDSVPDGVTYSRPLATRISAGKPLIDFSEGIHISKVIDNIPDGATRKAVTAIDGAGKALIDLSQAGHTNKNIDNVADGATYSRPLATRVSSGKPLIDFAEAIHLNKTADNIPDGSVARVVTLDEGNLLSGLGAQLAALGVAVVNGNAEDGLRYWRRVAVGTVTLATTATAYEGTKAFSINNPNFASNLFVYMEQVDRSSDISDPSTGNLVYIPVNTELPAQVYGRFRSRMSSGLEVGNLRMQVREYDSAKSLLRTTTIATVSNPGTTYTKGEGRVALGASTRFINLRFEQENTSGSSTTYADAVTCLIYYPAARCKAHLSADQTGIVSGTETVVNLNAEAYDYGALHDTVTNNSRVLVAGPGPVRGTAQIQIGAGATGHRRVRVKKNGTTFIAEMEVMAVTTAAQVTTIAVPFADDAAAGDYYEIFGTHTQGANLSFISGVGNTYLELQQGSW